MKLLHLEIIGLSYKVFTILELLLTYLFLVVGCSKEHASTPIRQIGPKLTCQESSGFQKRMLGQLQHGFLATRLRV